MSLKLQKCAGVKKSELVLIWLSFQPVPLLRLRCVLVATSWDKVGLDTVELLVAV